jgi:hypothetical protein
MQWNSKVEIFGNIHFPNFMGIRILMMPLHLEDQDGTLPTHLVAHWRTAIRKMTAPLPEFGVAYLTIDELYVPPGCHHRRPGLHVDGWSDDSDTGVWGCSAGTRA